jgi:hypothetical protein
MKYELYLAVAQWPQCPRLVNVEVHSAKNSVNSPPDAATFQSPHPNYRPAKNVDKMTENVDKMIENVEKMTENVVGHLSPPDSPSRG